jgi:hypothetical protein
MDVDLIICRIVHYLPKISISNRNLREINHQWNRMITYLYPHRFIWEENSEIISQLSVPKIDITPYELVFSTSCKASGLTIDILKLERTIFICFVDCEKKNYFFRQTPLITRFAVLDFVKVVIPNQFTNDGLHHYLICLRSYDYTFTFVDYTDLKNICVYKKCYEENNVDSSSLHYILASDFNSDNIFGRDFLNLSCLPFVNSNLLTQQFDYDFADPETITLLNADGSFFVKNSNIISLYNKGNMVSSMKFNSLLSEAKVTYACNKFIIVSNAKYVTIFNILTQECVLLFSMEQTDEVVQVINLTSSHFLLLLYSNSSVSALEGFRNNIDFYCLVDGDRAIYKKILKNLFIKNEFAYDFKVEQKSDEWVLLHYISYYAIKKHQTISFDLKNLCLIESLKL